MKIVIATSSTGGHIFPALSLAESLKQDNSEIYFIADKGRLEGKITEKEFCLETISASKIDFGSPLIFLKTTTGLIKSFFESLGLLKKIHPDAVIGFGGYASFPVVVAAWFLRIPAIIHEQNVIAGLANKLSAAFVKKIAVSFEETKKYFNPNKVVVTGCPIRQDLFGVSRVEALKELNLKSGKFTIMVTGGSQGSRRINQAFTEAISSIDDLSPVQIIHITGEKDFNWVKEFYSGINVDSCCVAFLDKMGYAYTITDLIISRAGASSLNEIISFQIPEILIPYPFAHNHQMANASVMAKNGAAIIIEDKDLSAEKLKNAILMFLNSKDALTAMKQNFEKFAFLNAADNLKAALLSVIRK